MKREEQKEWRRLLRLKISLITTITAVLLTGCSGGGSSIASTSTNGLMESDSYSYKGAGLGNSYDYAEESVYEDEVAYEDYESSSEPNNSTVENNREPLPDLVEEKLVYRADISLETTNYQESITGIKDLLNTYNCIIESESERDNEDDWYYRDRSKTRGTLTNTLVIRVPSSKFKEFTTAVGGYGRVKSKESSVDNISQEYYSNKIEIDVLKKEEARLLSMLDSAIEISDILEIERRLTEVEGRLQKLQNTIRYMDMDVAYSYVTIRIKEVVEYTEDKEPVKTVKFIDRLKNRVSDTWDDTLKAGEQLLFSLITLTPFIIILVLIIGVVKLIRKIRGNNVDKETIRDLLSYDAVKNIGAPMQGGMGAPMQNNVGAPTQNTETPTQNTETPTQNVETPTQNVETPTQNVETPIGKYTE